MAKEPIVSTLFRFATLRNPQLLSKREKNIGFIFFSTPQIGSSEFLADLDEEVDKESRRILLEGRAAAYIHFNTRKEVVEINPALYEFSSWLMKHKNSLTEEDVVNNTPVLTQLTTPALVKLWDNLFYQLITKKSDVIREAVIQMIVADNFYKRNDISSTKSFITNETELKRLANAFVVIGNNVVSNFLDQRQIPPAPIRKHFELLNKQTQNFETHIQKEDFETAYQEISEVIQINIVESKVAYENAHKLHQDAVHEAYSSATRNEDSETGQVSYTNLNIPKFSFNPPNIFSNDYLESKGVSTATRNIFDKLVLKGNDSKERILESLLSETSRLNSVIAQTSNPSKKSAFINGTLIVQPPVQFPDYIFSISNRFSIEEPSNIIVTVNLVTGYDDANFESASWTIVFDDQNNTTIDNVTLRIEKTTEISVILTTYPDAISIPNGSKSFYINAELELDNGEELAFRSNDIGIGGKIVNGQARSQSSSQAKIHHFGIKKIGVADFHKVEQEVCCYVPGDVSRIENILAREYRERSTRQLISTETTTENTSEIETEKLSDTTTSERNELSSEISSILTADESKNYGASAGISGSYPGSGISFYANGYFDGASSSSNSNSNSSAQTYAKEVTERALERVVQKVSEKRTSRLLKEFEENNKHGFDNSQGDSHVTGIYRWVDKLYTNRLINYGKRLMYEFNIPEPSRFFKDAIMETIEGENPDQISTVPGGLILPPYPADLTIESPSDLNEGNYQAWSFKYKAEVNAPPQKFLNIGKSFGGGEFSNSNGSRQFTFNDFEIPEGYKVNKISWIFDLREADNNNTSLSLHIANKNYDIKRSGNDADIQSGNFYPSQLSKSSIPISIVGWDLGSFALNVIIDCERTEEAYNQWINETFAKIAVAYDGMIRAYNDALYGVFEPTLPNVDDETRKMEFNPLLNRTLEKRELKRLAVQMLARPFNILTAKNNYSSSRTHISLNSSFEKHASYVKFFEQSFDWEIMAYVFYPYFYGQQADWKSLFKQSNGTDEIFQAFLQSSMARVVIPVKPGFENAVTYFMETGDIWIGNQLAVDRDDDLYLSIAEETQIPEGVVEDEWETRVPTDLTILQANAAPLDETGLPCCHNVEEGENLAFGNSIMIGKDNVPSA